jgi:hypothetical protein
MADLTSGFYYSPTLKANVRFILTGEYHIKPSSIKVFFHKELWSADRTVKQTTLRNQSYVEGAVKRQEWRETLLSNLIAGGMETMGDTFFKSSLNAILIREGLTDENKLI